MFLTEDQVRELTKRQKFKAQARQLQHMGIPYMPRTDGSLAVLRIHVEALTAAAAAKRDDKPKPRVRFD
jgi:hypothetical protein